jgi:hypothetical protein
MSEWFKSKTGWVLAGIYILTVYSFLMYQYVLDSQEGMSGFISMILSLPWSIILFYFVIPLASGGYGNSSLHIPYIASVLIGGLINALILYLLGLLVTTIYKHFSRKSKP